MGPRAPTGRGRVWRAPASPLALSAPRARRAAGRARARHHAAAPSGCRPPGPPTAGVASRSWGPVGSGRSPGPPAAGAARRSRGPVRHLWPPGLWPAGRTMERASHPAAAPLGCRLPGPPAAGVASRSRGPAWPGAPPTGRCGGCAMRAPATWRRPLASPARLVPAPAARRWRVAAWLRGTLVMRRIPARRARAARGERVAVSGRGRAAPRAPA